MWTTFDNRRLYALQRAAVKFWPKLCGTAVNTLTNAPHVRSAIRKFRSNTCGISVIVSETGTNRTELITGARPNREWKWLDATSHHPITHTAAGQVIGALDVVRQIGDIGSIYDLEDCPKLPAFDVAYNLPCAVPMMPSKPLRAKEDRKLSSSESMSGSDDEYDRRSKKRSPKRLRVVQPEVNATKRYYEEFMIYNQLEPPKIVSFNKNNKLVCQTSHDITSTIPFDEELRLLEISTSSDRNRFGCSPSPPKATGENEERSQQFSAGNLVKRGEDAGNELLKLIQTGKNQSPKSESPRPYPQEYSASDFYAGQYYHKPQQHFGNPNMPRVSPYDINFLQLEAQRQQLRAVMPPHQGHYQKSAMLQMAAAAALLRQQQHQQSLYGTSGERDPQQYNNSKRSPYEGT